MLYHVKSISSELRVLEEFMEIRAEGGRRNVVKRYVLLKAVCSEDVDTRKLRNLLSDVVRRVGGHLYYSLCSTDLIMFNPSNSRLLVRIRGPHFCARMFLWLISVVHLAEENPCIFAPLRTSGLLTRLRRMIR